MNNFIELTSHNTVEHMLDDLTTIINDSVVEGKDNKIIVHVKGTVSFDFTGNLITTVTLEGIEK